MAWCAVDRRQMKDNILRRRCKVQRERLAYICADILHPFVLFHDARNDALFSGHHKVKIVDLISRPDTFLP